MEEARRSPSHERLPLGIARDIGQSFGQQRTVERTGLGPWLLEHPPDRDSHQRLQALDRGGRLVVGDPPRARQLQTRALVQGLSGIGNAPIPYGLPRIPVALQA